MRGIFKLVMSVITWSGSVRSYLSKTSTYNSYIRCDKYIIIKSISGVEGTIEIGDGHKII